MYFALATEAKTEVAWRADCCSGWRGPGARLWVVGNAILAMLEKQKTTIRTVAARAFFTWTGAANKK
jgi:hypothetical protein